MTCTAYFNDTVCRDNVSKYKSWCYDHGKILIKIREKYKSMERKIYNHDVSIEGIFQPCVLENLDGLTITELNKKYVRLMKCIRLRKIFNQIGFNPEMRDFKHEYWVYKLEEDIKLIERILYNKYNTTPNHLELEEQEKQEKQEKQAEFKIKKDRPETTKPQEDYKKIIRETKLRFNEDIDKYGRKSWDDKTIASYLYGFILKGIAGLVMSHCIKHFGEYALRFYTTATNYIESCCAICCIGRKDNKMEIYNHTYTVYEICNDRKCNCFIIEHDYLRHQSLLYLFYSLQKYGPKLELPSWILDIQQTNTQTDKDKIGDISAPIRECLKAAISDVIDINIAMSYDRPTSLLNTNIGGVIHTKKHKNTCSCNSFLLIKINKDELLRDFPDIESRKTNIGKEMQKHSRQIILDY